MQQQLNHVYLLDAVTFVPNLKHQIKICNWNRQFDLRNTKHLIVFSLGVKPNTLTCILINNL